MPLSRERAVRVLLWRARVFQHSIPHDERGSYWLSPSASPAQTQPADSSGIGMTSLRGAVVNM